MKTTTQHKLLEATLKLISEKGYLGATTREIAKEAGVTELTLFRHFGSKEKLFEEVLNSYTFLPTLRELLPHLDDLSCEEALTQVATKFLLTMKKRKSMVKIMLSEVTRYPEKIRAVYSKLVDDVRSALAQYFRSLQQKGMFREVSPETAARVFLSILFAYFRNEEIVRGQEITRAKMQKNVREFVDIFMYGTVNSRQ
jgi:AcrR family transcriptional regulator